MIKRFRFLIVVPVLLLVLVFGNASTGLANNELKDKGIALANLLFNSTYSNLGHKPLVRLSNSTSLNWSGYAVETNLSNPRNYAVSDVKAQWTVPTVKATSTDAYSATWVGIDGYSDNTVEQIGTEQDWVDGAPVYYAWYEMYPRSSVTISSIPLHPGDKISAEVKYIGNYRYVLTIDDLSDNLPAFSTTQVAIAKRQSAEWIVEAPSSFFSVLPLANFGTETFESCNATLNNVTGPISNWPNDKINIVDNSGTAEDTTSGLLSGGTSFYITWLSAGSSHGRHRR